MSFNLKSPFQQLAQCSHFHPGGKDAISQPHYTPEPMGINQRESQQPPLTTETELEVSEKHK